MLDFLSREIYNRLSIYIINLPMEILLKKDWEWYLAEVQGKANLYAFWYSEEEAIQELKNVVDMMVDYYNEEMIFQKKIRKSLVNKTYHYAI